jgi:hypothetical protein
VDAFACARRFRSWPTTIAASSVKAADRFGLPGKLSQFLKNIQERFKEWLRVGR